MVAVEVSREDQAPGAGKRARFDLEDATLLAETTDREPRLYSVEQEQRQ